MNVYKASRYVAYVEVNQDDGSARTVIITVEQAIKEQREAGTLRFHRYTDDGAALSHFLVEHNAWLCDQSDGTPDSSTMTPRLAFDRLAAEVDGLRNRVAELETEVQALRSGA